jgi:hypothetical protein
MEMPGNNSALELFSMLPSKSILPGIPIVMISQKHIRVHSYAPRQPHLKHIPVSLIKGYIYTSVDTRYAVR